MTVRLLVASLFIAAPVLAGPALAGSETPTPAAVSKQQTAPATTTAPASTPLPGSSESGYSGGCPFGHTKSKTAATS